MANRINISIFVFILLIISCGHSGLRNLKEARDEAICEFKNHLVENDVDYKYYNGPVLAGEDEKFFTFTWTCNVPGAETAVYEEYVPKNSKWNVSYRHKGRFPPLRGTLFFPLNEAALHRLFELPPDPNDMSERARRLRMVPLTNSQMWDVANFSIITSDIRAYAECFNRAFPDSLSWLKNIEISDYEDDCTVKSLDSISTHDRYGYEYYYGNLINFIVLGTPGANRKWDFSTAIMDSIYNDNLEHIFINNDDIIVKLTPRSMGL